MNPLISKTKDGIKLEFSWLALGLSLILFLSIFNGYIDSLDFEYGSTDFWQCTYLGEPNDRHSDLVKGALSFVHEPPSNLAEWPDQYLRFYLHNPFGSVEDVSRGRLSVYGVTPFTLVLLMLIKEAILLSDPSTVVAAFYLVSWGILALLCWRFVERPWEKIFAFCALALSYPFMLMLTRGNMAAGMVGLMLMIYIYLACNQRLWIVAVVCLAVACNIRPNAVLLAPLLLCFGWKRAIGASALLLLLAGAIAATCYALAVSMVPGYSWQVFLQALDNYNGLYVMGPLGDANNNSAYGALKLIYRFLFLEMHAHILTAINEVILCISGILVVYATYQFWRNRLPAYYFAFTLACLYILASTVFATYHLLVLYVFVLAAGGGAIKNDSFPPVLLLMTVAVLIPKNYIYLYPAVSCEVILNPIILSTCVGWILLRKFPGNPALPVKENIRGRGAKTRKSRTA